MPQAVQVAKNWRIAIFFFTSFHFFSNVLMYSKHKQQYVFSNGCGYLQFIQYFIPKSFK
jgi:hypothetical protein